MRKKSLLGIRLAGGLEEEITPWAGISPLVELGRRSGVMGVAKRVLPAKRSQKALGEDQMVESFVLLSALGGEPQSRRVGSAHPSGSHMFIRTRSLKPV
jgi:hypothetical protein